MEQKIRVRKGTFTFADGPRVKDRTGTYYYSDDYFLRHAVIMNPHLRTLSLIFCMTCFPSMEAQNYDRVYRNAEQFLTENGFSDFQVNPDYEKAPTKDTLAMLVAHKVLTDRDGEVSLVVVGLRGAGYGDEWASNLILEEKGPAAGFYDCMHYANAYLKEYLESLGEKLRPRVKYWISGYSRVAGVSNLLGAWIDKHARKYRTETGDIFVYTFEGPACASKDDRRPYPSIHNTVNPHDLVPRVAPDVWGFRRYGADDTVLPPIHSEEFEKKIGEVQERLAELNPDLHYEPREFVTTFRRKGAQIDEILKYRNLEGRKRPDEWWYHAKQDEYLGRFMDFIGKKIAHPEDGDDPTDRERRIRFVTTYQDAFSQLAKSYLGVSEEARAKLHVLLGKLIKEEFTLPRKIFLFIKLNQNTELSCRQVELYLVRIISRRLLKEPDFEVNKQQMREFFGAIERLVYFGVKCASYDMRRHRLSYFSTAIRNIEQIKMAHMPEVIFSWMMTLDSYYHKDMSEYLIGG